jgi:subtilisin family serine protease
VSRPVAFLLAAILLVTFVAPVSANAQDSADASAAPTEGEVVPGEVVVKYVDPEAGAEAAEADGLEVMAELGSEPEEAPLLVSTEGQPVEEVLEELNADPAVEYAEPNYVVSLASEPTPEPAADVEPMGETAAIVPVNDPKTSAQYSLDRMQVRSAWNLSKGGAGIVAVLDTGVQFNHPDLAGRLLPGHDFVNNDSNASDDQGHGTWVSGIIAANQNDGYGIAGISWTDKILPVKTMNSAGLGDTSDLTAGIVWAADHGATVINLSVGGFPYSKYVQDAVNYAWSKGAVIIGAAGNNRREETYYPASYTNVVSVSATQPDDEFANWSSYGSKVDVSAPGASILTTNCMTCNTWGTHVTISGTSFATPNTAGVVALLRGKYPDETPAQIVNRLLRSVDDQGYAGWDNRYGLGRVNAARALGGGVTASGVSSGDGLERNNTLATARKITLGSTAKPSIHPAGDVDVFAVDVPRAGRLDVRVTGVVDTARVLKSSLPIDPIVEIYSTAGTLLLTVDKEWETGVELASRSVSGPTRLLIRIRNYYANGSRAAYTITPTFVDNVAPTVTGRTPAPNVTAVRFDGATVTADFSESVTGLSGTTVQLKGPGGTLVPATVSGTSRRATLHPTVPLAAETAYTVSLTAGIKDAAGNALAATTWKFTTGKAATRVFGPNRFGTAAALSASAFAPGVPVVYIATGTAYPDALTGGPAAAVGGGPLLFADSTSLPAATVAELVRLQPGRIVVLGGPAAVSSRVFRALDAYTPGTVTRVYGADRYGTAAAISAATFAPDAPVAYIATGASYPDGLAAGAVAAGQRAPLLLTRPDVVPAEILAELQRLSPARIVVMGGTSAISDAVLAQLRAIAPDVQRITGPDRYDTSAALSAASFAANSVSTVYVATGRSWPDGLSAGPVAAKAGAPLLLVSSTMSPAVAAELRRLDPTNIVIVGGSAAVSDALRNEILALWE